MIYQNQDLELRKDFLVLIKKTNRPYPGVDKCAEIPLYLFEEEEEVEEIVEIENEDDIV
jgi:hypothetical protein